MDYGKLTEEVSAAREAGEHVINVNAAPQGVLGRRIKLAWQPFAPGFRNPGLTAMEIGPWKMEDEARNHAVMTDTDESAAVLFSAPFEKGAFGSFALPKMPIGGRQTLVQLLEGEELSDDSWCVVMLGAAMEASGADNIVSAYHEMVAKWDAFRLVHLRALGIPDIPTNPAPQSP